MNQLITSNQPLTMSTREIAKLLDKQHSHIKISAERLSEKGTIALRGSKFEHNGNIYEEYLLEKRDCFILVAQNSPEFTAAIVDRWQELEKINEQKLPQTKREWIEFALEQEKKLELAAPKVAFVDNLVDRTNLLTATQIGQKHKLSAIKLNKILVELNVYNGNVKRSKVFKQWFIDKGYGEMKKTELGYDQPLFTNAGEIWINEQLHSEGIV